MTPAAEIVEATVTEHVEQVRCLFRNYQSELPEPFAFLIVNGSTFPENLRRPRERCCWPPSRVSRRAASVCVRFR